MKRVIRTLSLFFAVILGAQAASAAVGGRGVYANGQVHRVYLDAVWGNPTYVAGIPTADSSTPPNYVLTTSAKVVAPWFACDYTGGNIAVYDNKIYFAFVSDDMSICGETHPRAYVAVFDMNPGVNNWTTIKNLGPVRNDNGSKGSKAGAAIVVFKSTLYVFTNHDTYTSTDGVSWATLQKNPTPLVADQSYEPLDAITIYPPDSDPEIHLIYGYDYTVYLYQPLYAGSWDGKPASVPAFASGLKTIYSSTGDNWVDGSVSLTAGTLAGANGFQAGAMVASLQLFFQETHWTGKENVNRIRRMEWAYGKAGSAWTLDPKVYSDGDHLYNLWVYPWYTLACNEASPKSKVQRQHIAVNYTNDSDGKKWKAFGFDSDYLVPQNPGINSASCASWDGNWGGTGTNTDPGEGDADTVATLRKYWSLVGVVLGSPPFAVNNITDGFDLANLSNLKYGQETKTGVTQTQTWENAALFSAGLEVSTGLFDEFLEVADKADLSYKRAWEHEHETSSSSIQKVSITMGTDPSSEDEAKRGRWGWGIFLVPTIVVQDFALYAYDYDFSGKGTPLNQNLHTVNASPGGLSYTTVGFDLTNPTIGDVTGLMDGIGPFPASTDLNGWMAADWETNPKAWTVKLGDGTLNETKLQPLKFGSGTKTATQFTEETDSVDVKGQTTSIEVSNEISVGLKLAGFKASLKTGYEGSFSTSVSNQTSFATDLEAELNMKSCSGPDCVKTVSVQPYWLEAVDGSAPWIPDGFKEQRPWCITWKVSGLSYETGATAGMSPAPRSTAGLVVSGQGGTKTVGESLWGGYALEGAFLGWTETDGTKTPIPMTAADFKPARGVTLSLNGFSWSSVMASGTWTQLGKVWLFETRPSAQRNKVTLKLDFGRGAWSVQIRKVDLSGYLEAGSGAVQVRLNVNGKYMFQNDLQHHVDTAWRWQELPQRPDRMELTAYEGRHSTSTATGAVVLEGTLPAVVERFGDMSFEINGHKSHVPLLGLEEYLSTRARGGVLEYDKKGVRVRVDFTNRTWSASFAEEGFHQLQSPRWGTAKIRIGVGGTTWYSKEHRIVNFTSQLKLRG